MKHRKLKAILYVTGILLAVPVIYILMGCPSVTPEMGMRRAERAQLVGPSTILGTEDIRSMENGKLIIARSEDGCLLYPYTSSSYDGCPLYYLNKAGDITITSVCDEYDIKVDDPSLPIVVFDDYPEAVRAELELSYGFYYNDEYYENGYFLQARRGNGGYFLFSLPFNPNAWTVIGNELIENEEACKENSLIHIISEMLSGEYLCDGVPVTVRLYDIEDALIMEKSLLVGCTGQ